MNCPNPSSTGNPLHDANLRDYSAPQLTLYGTVNELTKSGGATSGEGGSPLPKKAP